MNYTKNQTLFRNNKESEFPDAPTARGTKHLKTLIDASKKGFKTYVLFLVQIENMKYFKIAKDIDKDYYQNYLIAKKSGVKFLAYRCKISPKEIKIEKKLKQWIRAALIPHAGRLYAGHARYAALRYFKKNTKQIIYLATLHNINKTNKRMFNRTK